MFSTGSIGTEVSNAETSYEQRHSPSKRVTPLTLFTKPLVLCIWWGDLPKRGLNTLVRTLATPQVPEPWLEIMGLRGTSFMDFCNP